MDTPVATILPTTTELSDAVLDHDGKLRLRQHLFVRPRKKADRDDLRVKHASIHHYRSMLSRSKTYQLTSPCSRVVQIPRHMAKRLESSAVEHP